MKTNSKGLTPYWYTPTTQNEGDPPAEFQVQPVSSLKMLEILDLCKERDGTAMLTAAARHRLLAYGITNWRHVMDDDGDSEAEFSLAGLMSLDFKLLIDLSAEVQAASTLGEDHVKN